MRRGVRWYLVGSLVVMALAGCGRLFFAEREPWRREAELACLRSGAVREGPGVARTAPIDGPGVCGADFPLKVAALGHGSALGFSGELRPPGEIPTGSLPRWPVRPAPSISSAPLPPLTSSPPPTSLPSTSLPPEPGLPLDLSGSLRRDEGSQEEALQPAPLPPHVPLRPLPFTGPVEVKPAATLACPLVAALDHWMVQAVQPAAQRWFRQPVVEIRQISSYSCRSMNNQRGARISEHAFGNALDIAAFVLADGRMVKVRDGWRGAPEEQGFLRDVQAAACEHFTTVLAPGADAFHYDHIHVDLMRRANGRRICQPEAVDGEIVAARAQRTPAPLSRPAAPPRIDERNDPYAWRGPAVRRTGPMVTGSVAGRPDHTDPDWVEDDGPRPPLR
ncbi:MAG TPA: extensin family protein [Xanthobacteraceae bacterium]|nr:extensin family protein [Xanthobacteraceae bacterium]